MRVLMVTPGFYPIKGGAETMVRNISVELNRMGVHVDVMTFNMDARARMLLSENYPFQKT